MAGHRSVLVQWLLAQGGEPVPANQGAQPHTGRRLHAEAGQNNSVSHQGGRVEGCGQYPNS